MHYHIILTTRCNSQCIYCYEKSMNDFGGGDNREINIDISAPESSEVDIDSLKKFIEKDQDPIIIFYGGEPLLEIEKMIKIMDNIDVPYRMQTNGKLLNRLPIKYLNKIDKILVSIDGTKERTDYNRGSGTYDLVMKNLSLIKEKGYKGEIIARMTLSIESPDIFEQVLYLLENGFSSIHWQIDAGFYSCDYKKEEFDSFVEEYNKSITKLIRYWVEQIQNKNVIKLYPFIAIVDSLLKNEKTSLRCGAGHSGYAIRTDGKIIACPIMSWISDFIAGDLNSNPNELKKFQISGKCISCEIKDICGGRCLYWNYLDLWPEDGNEAVCKTIKNLISEIEKKMPQIRNCINKNIINYKDFEYEKYFGPEIIP